MKKSVHRSIIFLTLFVSLFSILMNMPLISADGTATDGSTVYQCGTIESAGNYFMNQSITATEEIGTGCIEILANSVILDMNGYSIDGNSQLDKDGILISSYNYITIKNGTISNFITYEGNEGCGISTYSDNSIFTKLNLSFNNIGICVGGTNNTITDIASSSSLDQSIWSYGLFNSLISNMSIVNAVSGINLLFGSINNTFSNISVINSGTGIQIVGSNNTLFSNTFSLNKKGISISGSGNNLTDIVLSNNLQPVMINTTLMEELTERAYNANQQIEFNISIYQLNGSISRNFNYNISIYPNTGYTATNISNNITIRFTPVKNGVYGVVFNITTLPDNNMEIKKFIFLVGNRSSDMIRYYFHADEPAHGQSGALAGADSGAMFSYNTTSEEIRSCGQWIQYSPDEIVKPLYIIKNISINWWYIVSGATPLAKIEKYATYSNAGADYLTSIPAAASYTFNNTNFTDLNITSDYLWRPYWLSIKMSGSSPRVKSNSTDLSYADIYYLYAGPRILQFSENPGYDIRNASLLSSVFNDDSQKDASLQLEGSGNFTIALNLTNSTYLIKYDNMTCGSNSNCTINQNSSGLINVTISLGSFHQLDINPVLPVINVNSPLSQAYTTRNISINFTASSPDGISSKWYYNGTGNATYTNVTSIILPDGEYMFVFYANDTLGNVNSTNISFSVSVPSSDLGSTSRLGGGGAAARVTTFSISDTQFSNGYVQNLNTGQRLKLIVGNETHYVGVIQINPDSVVVNVSSDEQQAILFVGQSRKFEVTGDNYYDIKVTLNNITGNNSANINVMHVHDMIINQNTDTGLDNIQYQDWQNVATRPKYITAAILIIFIIVATAAGIVVLLENQNKNKIRRSVKVGDK